jgi:hypothetical protein
MVSGTVLVSPVSSRDWLKRLPGCHFSSLVSCTGTATPCSQLSADTCASNPGCYLSTYPYPYGL